MVTTTSHEAQGSNGAGCVEMMESCELRRRGKPGSGCGDGPTAEEEDGAAAEASVERAFAGKPVPSWREQLTVRAFVVSFFLAVMFSVIVMKLNLTTGIIPSLNVSAGLLGFFFVRIWTKTIESVGLLKQPFTRQENTVIQTCVVAAYGLAFSGICVAGDETGVEEDGLPAQYLEQALQGRDEKKLISFRIFHRNEEGRDGEVAIASGEPDDWRDTINNTHWRWTSNKSSV